VWCSSPSLFLYSVEAGGCRGNIPEHTPTPSSSHSILSAHEGWARGVLGGRGHTQGACALGLAPLGPVFVPPPHFWVWIIVAWWAQLGLVMVWPVAPPLPLYAFQKAYYLVYFTCTWCYFLQSDNSSSTSGIRLIAKVYVCKMYNSLLFGLILAV
jgi:hypothetical protein